MCLQTHLDPRFSKLLREEQLISTNININRFYRTDGCSLADWLFKWDFSNELGKLDNVQLCKTQIEGIKLRIWTRPSKLIIIIWQERQTRVPYLISLSPYLFENIAFVLSALWWYDNHHIIYDYIMIIIGGYDDTEMLPVSYPHRKYLVCMV